MKKAAPILFLIAIFAVGAVSGGFAGYYYGRSSFYRRPPKPDQMSESMRRFMTDRLGLNPEQSQKLIPLVKDMSKAMQAVHEENHQRFGKIMKEFDAKLVPLLDPEQLKKLDELRKEHERDRGGWGPKPSETNKPPGTGPVPFGNSEPPKPPSKP
jgi:hypothetical protein